MSIINEMDFLFDYLFVVVKVDMTHLVNPQERSASGETGVGAAQKDV